jgi:microcystin-dependent protein
LLTLPALLYKFWNWEFNSDGTATADAKKTLNYLQPGDFIWSATALVPTIAPGARLPCDGAQYASTDYPDLFLAVGTTFGGGTTDGRGGTLFNVPNAQGRSLVAVGTSTDVNSVNTTYVLGDKKGEASHSLTLEELAPHTHGYGATEAGSGLADGGTAVGTVTRQTLSAGGDGSTPPVVVPHNNWSPVFGAYLYIQS